MSVTLPHAPISDLRLKYQQLQQANVLYQYYSLRPCPLTKQYQSFLIAKFQLTKTYKIVGNFHLLEEGLLNKNKVIFQTEYSKGVIQSISFQMGCVNTKDDSFGKQRKQSNATQKPVRHQRLDGRKRSFQVPDKILENVSIVSHNLDGQSQLRARESIDEHYLFSDLSDEEKDSLVSQMVLVKGKKDDYIFQQGDKGYCFFIIKEGRVAVQVNKKQAKVLGQGQTFGQLALIYCAVRSASIRCLDERTTFLVMKSFIFKKKMEEITLRNASKLKKIVERVKIFSYLTNKQKHIISNNLVRQPFARDQVIFQVLQPANSFYIIEKGSVRIEIKGKQNIIIKEEDSFGQNSFYQNGFRSGSAYAQEDGTLLVSIGKNQIEKCLGESIGGLIHHNIKKWAITRSELFSQYIQKEVDIIAEAFQIKFSKGDQEILMPKDKHPTAVVICMEGQINGQPPGSMFCDHFYGRKENILQEDIIKNDKGVYALLEFKTLAKMNQAFKREQKGSRRVTYLTDKCLTGPQFEAQRRKYNDMANQKAKCEFQSLEVLQKLGKGQFGNVYLVRNPNRRNVLYAMKCISIEAIKKEGIEACLISERKILENANHPAIVGFVEAYRDRQFVYFLMEHVSGVEMFDVLRQIGLLNSSIAVYFIGSLLAAIEYLHSLGIVYRDLKPENAIVGHDGQVSLIDMGTAKALSENNSYRTFTIIGTPHYLAPEIFQGKGYSFEVDYWSLGVMLYEFLYGTLPYGNNATDPMEIFTEIITQPLKFPSFVNDPDAETVITRFLSKNSVVRSANNGFTGIKKMNYFANVDWGSLTKRGNSPYIPKKFRNFNLQQHYQEVKGQPFLERIYKDYNQQSKQKKIFQSKDSLIQVWNGEEL